jgi:hypothetical protein
MMSEEFAGPNCRRQSVIYPDATQDHGRVVCHTCGPFLGTLSHSAVSACARGRGRYEPLVGLHLHGWIPMHRGRVWIGASKSSASGSHRRRRDRKLLPHAVVAPQGRKEFPLPPIDVVFGDSGKQRMVAGASFLERHGKRLRDRAGDRFRIIGIDQQGAPEFDRGTGEARQDEDARIVRIRSGDIFLRNEVHAVAQRRHLADAGCPIEPRQHRPAVAAVHVTNRRP